MALFIRIHLAMGHFLEDDGPDPKLNTDQSTSNPIGKEAKV